MIIYTVTILRRANLVKYCADISTILDSISFYPSCQTNVSICANKNLHVHQLSDAWIMEQKYPFKNYYICRIYLQNVFQNPSIK
jgi:hypothetical protein